MIQEPYFSIPTDVSSPVPPTINETPTTNFISSNTTINEKVASNLLVSQPLTVATQECSEPRNDVVSDDTPFL